MAPWVELASVQYSDGSPTLGGSGHFRQIDSETDLVLAPITAQDGAAIEGHWGFQFRDGARVLADYPTEQDARDELSAALSVCAFSVQGAESSSVAKPAARKRAGSS